MRKKIGLREIQGEWRPSAIAICLRAFFSASGRKTCSGSTNSTDGQPTSIVDVARST